MRRTISIYRRIEHTMEITAFISAILVALGCIYIFGITGSLEVDALTIQQAVIRLIIALVSCVCAGILHSKANQIRRKCAHRRIRMSRWNS